MEPNKIFVELSVEPKFLGLVEPKLSTVESFFAENSLILAKIFANFYIVFNFGGTFQNGGSKPRFVELNKMFVKPFFKIWLSKIKTMFRKKFFK